MPKTKKPARRSAAAPAEARNVTPAGEIRLDELTALRILRAAAVVELGKARVANVRAEALRVLEQIDTEGRFRALDRQLGELVASLGQADAELTRLSSDVGARYGIDPAAYVLDETAHILRKRDADGAAAEG